MPYAHNRYDTQRHIAMQQLLTLFVSVWSHLDVVIHVGHVLDLLEPFISADLRGPCALVSLLSVNASLHVSGLARQQAVTPSASRAKDANIYQIFIQAIILVSYHTKTGFGRRYLRKDHVLPCRCRKKQIAMMRVFLQQAGIPTTIQLRTEWTQNLL